MFDIDLPHQVNLAHPQMSAIMDITVTQSNHLERSCYRHTQISRQVTSMMMVVIIITKIKCTHTPQQHANTVYEAMNIGGHKKREGKFTKNISLVLLVLSPNIISLYIKRYFTNHHFNPKRIQKAHCRGYMGGFQSSSLPTTLPF
jgi:hypothetical protein